MEDLQLRIQLRSTLQGYVNDLMSQYQISATMMEEALSGVLLLIKDAATNEYAEWAMQNNNQTIQQLQSALQELAALKEEKDIEKQKEIAEQGGNPFEAETPIDTEGFVIEEE